MGIHEDDTTITEEQSDWAEHTLLLYLERGGLSAVQVYKLNPDDTGPSATSSRGIPATTTLFPGTSSMNRSSLMKTLRSSGSKNSVNSTGSNGSGMGSVSSSIRESAINRMKSMKLSSSRNGLRSSTIGDDVISHGAKNQTWGSNTGSSNHHRNSSDIPVRNNTGRDDISGSQLYLNSGEHSGRSNPLSSSSNARMNLRSSLRKKLGLSRSSKK